MQCSFFLLVLWLFLHPAISQNRGPDQNGDRERGPRPNGNDRTPRQDSSSVDARCMRLRPRPPRPVRILPMSCNNMGFYDNDDAVFNGGRINALPRVLDTIIFDIINPESTNNSQCSESVQRYLCHYYFPRCDLTTGQVIAVCNTSCESLYSNDDCDVLLMLALEELRSNSIPHIPDESCETTHRSYTNPPSLSDECTEIEVPLLSTTTDSETTNNDIINNGATDSNDTTIDTANNDINNNNASSNITGSSITNNETTKNNDTDTTNNVSQDGSSTSRCVSFRPRPPVPRSCDSVRFYDNDDAVFNGSQIRRLPRVLDATFATLNEESDDLQCIESVQRYFCHYYFPRCNLTTDEIIPVCTSDCDSLIENNDCHYLFMRASVELSRESIPTIPDESCSRTHQMFNDDRPPISQSCTDIEVPLDENDSDSETEGRVPFDENDSDSDASSDTTNDGSNTIVVAAVVAIVAVLVTVVITALIVLLVVRRRRGKKINSVKFMDAEEPKVEENREERYIVTQVSRNYDSDKTELEMKDHSSQVNELLKYVEEKFSDVLFKEGVITKSDLIGKGAFGIVHKGELKNSDGTFTAVAIKSIKSQSLDGMKDLVAESSIMKNFDHPNVLPLLGIRVDYDDEDVLKVVIPFMANGDLKTFLKNKRVAPSNTHEYSKDLSENMLMRMCLDIAKGMEYVAHKRVVHRDLAARNCMVDEKLNIKVADFGLTRDIYSSEYYRADKHVTLPVKWMSLESLLDGYFDEKTDVWSYGITCWEIFSLGRIPYPGVNNADVISFIKHGKRLDKPELCPSMMFELIEKTWLEESSKRPTFAGIVEDLQTNIRKASVTSEADKNNYVDIVAQ